MRPQNDDYPEHIERAIKATIADGLEAGAEALAPIAFTPFDVPSRSAIRTKTRCAVFRRDGFRCRYCGGEVIPTPIMELVAGLYHHLFPWVSDGWPGGKTHPAFILRSPFIDHVDPHAWGGPNDLCNLVTACNPCNAIKADLTLQQLNWELREIPKPDGWDGLVSYYQPHRSGR